jgi:TatD DNase family protein
MKFINIHTHKFSDNPDYLEIVNQYPNEFDKSIPQFSIGIHPWYIIENEIDNYLKIIENQLENPNCLALGECGLDKRTDISMELQIQVFENQLLLAQKYNKPVILHCVAAFAETIEIKKRLKITVPMIIHGFSKNYETAKLLLDNGFCISFGKYLLQNENLKSVFEQIPNNRFFLETDTINESIEDVYKIAAEYKKLKMNELQEILNNNFNDNFNCNINYNNNFNKKK